MKNNPFVIFVTAFLVVMGSGFAIAAIGGPETTGGGVGESAFSVDFGGEIPTTTETSEMTGVPPVRDVQEQGDDEGGVGLDQGKDVSDPDTTETEKEPAEVVVVTGDPAKEDKSAEIDESTWIEVLAPTDGQVFDDKKVVFEGAAEPGAEVYAGEYQADIGADGVWRIVLFLSKGSQTVQFKAIDAEGNRATDSVTVSLEADESTSVEFTVHQKYVESHEPFEKFFGTGTPGMGITASSEYGSSDVRVGEHGEWWLPVEFAGLTETTTFPITISTTEGFSGTYSFTYAAKTHEFTVHQKYVESHEPFEKFFGTGTPGMGILAQSEYGTEDARVGENGEWYLPIEFSGLTETTTFPITISTTGGFSGTYWFSYVSKAHVFTANQKYGSCSENPPYDVFWGTGVPGAVVEIESAHGNARLEVGDGGWWEKKIFFETAPVGVTFEVVVTDSLGNAETFSFTRLEGDSK